MQELIDNGMISTIINCAVSYDDRELNNLKYVNYLMPRKYLLDAIKQNIKFITFGSFFEKYVGAFKREYILSKLKLKSDIERINYRHAHYLTLEHIYGNYDSPSKFIPWVVSKIKNKEVIHLNDPFTVRDYTPVEYVVQAVRHVVNTADCPVMFDVGTSLKTVTFNFVEKLYRYHQPYLDNFDSLITFEENSSGFDVVRNSVAVNTLDVLKVSLQKHHLIENQTFDQLFK